jgi:hypothetical protein
VNLILLRIAPIKLIFYTELISVYRKALTVLRGPLAYPSGLLDLHIETFVRTP